MHFRDWVKKGMSNGGQLHCFRFPRKRNACRNTGIARWLRTRNAEAAENCFLMSPSFSIYPRSRYGGKKYFRYVAFQRHRDATQRRISAIVLVSFSNFFERHVFSFAVVSEQTIIKKIYGMQMFVYSFIYCLCSTNANSIYKSAKCAFFVPRSVCRYDIKSHFVFLRLKQILNTL